MDIRIDDGRFVSRIYDKRRDFNFDILGLPSFNSNVPINMTYGVMCSQFCRFALVCQHVEDFIFNCQLFINKLQEKGYRIHIFKKYVQKFSYNKMLTLSKYNINLHLANSIF